ncbi:MAG TPA: chromate efflux transporter [Thermoanaerobaculia bacterium]|nr:chromate efflux transporter [Thermoanaerobaculia bacterium]
MARVPFGEAFRVWCRVAALSFGGPAGQIAVMQRILVDEKRWIGQDRFLHALNYCMLLPGPEAQQLATYVGWLLHRTRGGLVAGTLFVLPGFLSILALSVLYAGFGESLVVAAIFFGLKPAVLAIVVEALVRIGRRALQSPASGLVAAGAFVAIFFFDVPFPWIVGVAALVGWGSAGRRRRREGREAADPEAAGPEVSVEAPAGRPAVRRALRITAVWLALWWGPVLALWALFGPESVFLQESLFFSKASVVTFGGAYAVLAYIAQRAVEDFGWLAPGEMLDGLGMAETTPGPLIQVVQFVGFMGAYRFPGTLDPMVAGVLGSVVVTWVTFVPCFLWIFLGAPYVEWLRGRRALSEALSAITAAVVGVILNLAVWFALHTLFGEVTVVEQGWLRLFLPEWSRVEWGAVVIAAGAFLALFGLRWGMLRTLAASVAIGLLWTTLAGGAGG